MSLILQRRAYGGVLFLLTFLAIAALTRLALSARAVFESGLEPALLPKAFFIGLLYDTLTACYFALPFTLYWLVVPDRIYLHRWHKPVIYAGHIAALFILLFTAAAEWVFWDEFGTRFNFIAVDYLVYTHEVIGNIQESYPLPAIFAALFALTLLVFFALKGPIDRSLRNTSTLGRRAPAAAIFLLIPAVGIVAVDGSGAQIGDNRYANELAGNGIYDFFAAFRNNQLDYPSFYRTVDSTEALDRLKGLLAEKHARFVGQENEDIRRDIVAQGPEKRLNVVLITVESLSASYLGSFGNPGNLTPNLDKLAQESLLFTNLYATGTRTVRGLEALTLSLPPTPGQSIVKRPNNGNLFSTGFIFREKGYDTRFIYGGFGYFDNMNEFFAGNGFDIVDRASMDKDEIHFANVWGIADEDLFAKTLKEMDASYARGKPSFNMLMTTSNHRPYTYPEGRIDIPSHTGKFGGVKYTDYAIGQFIEQARSKPWFDDTVFVIVADHCASSAGKTKLPVDKYQIPLIVYSPKHIQPGRVTQLASQIDVPPTLLGLLNFSYQTKFYGHDILQSDDSQARAFISNYQELGLLKNGKLTVLSPKENSETLAVDAGSRESTLTTPDPGLLQEAITYYQTASDLYNHHHYGRLN
ncbi:LTA synthase family protein [Methylococcus sp. EFPC2]|uniref:LTA synthase family protein n=1 Tax=Methylococcus sp. EFPC2 TaxID=2812648 RepID=UPI001966D164|nr:LTA synthase family protein [Methylococcus sp. EFPC2]QSA95829.1 sulfatase-like hydrolase/transferase [Methylococcus sp. EFPC2]